MPKRRRKYQRKQDLAHIKAQRYNTFNDFREKSAAESGK
jgi:hypothetical protein